MAAQSVPEAVLQERPQPPPRWTEEWDWDKDSFRKDSGRWVEDQGAIVRNLAEVIRTIWWSNRDGMEAMEAMRPSPAPTLWQSDNGKSPRGGDILSGTLPRLPGRVKNESWAAAVVSVKHQAVLDLPTHEGFG